MMRLIWIFLSTLSLLTAEQYPMRFEGFFPEFEKKPLDLIAKFLPENPIIFEAGAHYGTDTLNFAKRWPKATIISFEPNPHAFQIFSETTKDLTHVLKNNLAVNNYNGTAILHVCHGSTGDNPIYEGASSLLEPSEWMQIHYQGPKVEVPCVILDDWCKENGFDHIDFMWLDLEGLEHQVLQSSPHILSRVKVIFTETNFLEFRKGMSQFKSLREFLTNSGFTLFSHWYAEGMQGNAIFVKKEVFPLGFKVFKERG